MVFAPRDRCSDSLTLRLELTNHVLLSIFKGGGLRPLESKIGSTQT